MDDLDRTVRPAGWWEYFGLAGLVARRLAESRDPAQPPGGPLRRTGLWVTTLLTLVAYGAWTTEHRQAVASWWVLDDNHWQPARRALPAIVLVVGAEVTLFALTPPWVPVATVAVLAVLLGRLWRMWRARADLRSGRRRGAVYIANLASRHKGAGRVVLDHITATAGAQGRFTCLEATSHPGLVAYYTGHGFVVVRSVDAGDGHRVIYMERPPSDTSRPQPAEP